MEACRGGLLALHQYQLPAVHTKQEIYNLENLIPKTKKLLMLALIAMKIKLFSLVSVSAE
jgi:hypothetical protein